MSGGRETRHAVSGLSPTDPTDDSSSVSFSDGGGVGSTGFDDDTSIEEGATFAFMGDSTSKGAYVICVSPLRSCCVAVALKDVMKASSKGRNFSSA